MKNIIDLEKHCGNFAENKDVAREIRQNFILPAIQNEDQSITVDFDGIDSSTQSFMHALISEVLQKHGETVLDRIEFKNCNKAIKSLIGTVVNYSLE
jgi:hypothetical protein